MSSAPANPPSLAELLHEALNRDDAFQAVRQRAATLSAGKLAGTLKDLPDLEQKLRDSLASAEREQTRAVALCHQEYTRLKAALEREFQTERERHQQSLQSLPLPELPGWPAEAWRTFDFEAQRARLTEVPKAICAGEVQLATRWTTPFYAPFADLTGPLILETKDEKQRDLYHGVLKNLVWRLSVMLPGQVAFHFIDPNNSGNAFLWANRLPGRVESTGDLYRDLVQVENAFKRITSNYLNGTVTRFTQIHARERQREKLNVVVIADFPRGFDTEPRCLEVIRRIGDNGTAGGAYLFIHRDATAPEPRGLSTISFKAPINLRDHIRKQITKDTALVLDLGPTAEQCAELMPRLEKAGVSKSKLGYTEIVGLPTTGYWKEASVQGISTPIGTRGGDHDALRILFGANERGQQIPHGVVAAATGQGKSNFFHVLILGLAERYSPDELRFYLVDGKEGVELQPYRSLPHAEVVSLNTAPQLARSLLAELIQEMSRRNALFRQHEVKEYPDYRKKRETHPGLPNLPRLLLIVDEYQMLFDDDKDGTASAALADLSRTSRSVGIHMLLASQRFGAANMLRRDEIFSQMALLVAMKMAPSEIATMSEFEREGKDAINALDGPGKVVVNEHAGRDGHNRQGIVALIDKNQELKDRIQKLVEHARETGVSSARTIVFSGLDQPRMRDLPALQELAAFERAPSPDQLQVLALRPLEQRGAGLSRWLASYQPRLGWIGQEFNVHGYACIQLQRENSSHVLFAGGSEDARHGMVLSLLTSLALNLGPAHTHFLLLDRTPRGTPWETVFPFWVQAIAQPGRFNCRHETEMPAIESALVAAGEELRRRRSLDETARRAQPTLVIVLAEPDQLEQLERPASRYAEEEPSPVKNAFQSLLADGPKLGIHLVLSVAGKHALERILDLRRSLRSINQRVLVQMSDTDASEFSDDIRTISVKSQNDRLATAVLIEPTRVPLKFKPVVCLQAQAGSTTAGALEDLKTFTAAVTRWTQG